MVTSGKKRGNFCFRNELSDAEKKRKNKTRKLQIKLRSKELENLSKNLNWDETIKFMKQRLELRSEEKKKKASQVP